jgi:hypothetical protein
MKQYLSPYIELGIDTDTQDQYSLNLAKKKMLADIELSHSHTIMRGKREMTKDDVLKAFDNISATEKWEYHKLIAGDDLMLQFLQESKLDAESKIKDKPEHTNTDFVRFISPYFSFTFLQVVLECLKKRQPNRMNNLIYKNPYLMTDADAQEVWSKVDVYLNDKIEALDAISDQIPTGVKFDDNDLGEYYAKSMMECLNLLPEGDFDHIRNSYAISMYNFSANAWNAKQRYQAIDFATNAQTLALGDYERDLIDKRIAFFNEEMEKLNPSTSKTTSGGDSFNWKTVLYIVIALLQIARACSRMH